MFAATVTVYNSKQYDKAAELFENPDWKAAAHYKSGAFDKALENLKNNSSANSLYNQGNALAQSGQLQEALDAYKKALKLNPDDNDTLYNKDLVEKELEKQKQEQKQDQQKQDQDKKQDSQDKKNQEQNKEGDKSGQPEQDKNQEKQDEQKEADKKPEQKSEQSQESAEQQPEKKEAEKQEQENQPEAAKPEQTDPKKDDKKPDAASTKPLDAMTNEEKQANEQWLKRIPDDPAGLLKRKFKYQYDQRGQQ
jgi:Ca-activated chloride channel homolog